jgi:catechol 2,3-dioxygenase-like lactoylglutathione lyase family enzyme
MISRGNATIVVADMDRSIRFYTEVLGLKLTNRFGDDWATVSAGEGLTIGIHPASANYPNPGTKGAVVSIKGSVVRSDSGNFANLEDPDGNDIYLWEKTPSIRERALAESGV